MRDDDETTFKNRLDLLQYRMAEIVFRPGRVVRACWRGGRPTINRYMLAFLTVFLPALGFGIVMGWAMSGSEHFLFGAERTFTRQLGEAFMLIWMIAVLYLLAIGITIIVMGWFRKGPRRG